MASQCDPISAAKNRRAGLIGFDQKLRKLCAFCYLRGVTSKLLKGFFGLAQATGPNIMCFHRFEEYPGRSIFAKKVNSKRADT